MLGAVARQAIRRNRRSGLLRLAASACEKYLRAYHNEGFWDFDRNGEAFALNAYARWSGSRPIRLWDVGAHRGEWADAAHAIMPAASIHSFEIVPELAGELADRDWLTVHRVGLSDFAGETDVHWNRASDTTNTINPFRDRDAAADTQVVRCPVTTGDEMMSRIGAPNLLKIDVEGHETHVFRGCRQLLSSEAPPEMIQFEYGSTYLASGSTLGEIYVLLTGYQIGRLFPDHVDFKPYRRTDDDFRMGNMVAVRDPALRDLLANA